MKIIAFTGMPFSGKTEAVKIANNMNIDVIRMGDIVWEEVKKKGLELNDKNVGFIANQMREEFGQNIWAIKTIEKIKSNYKNSTIIIDGIRNFNEIKTFKRNLTNDFTLIAIISTDENRHKRALSRGRKDDSKILNEIKKRDEREISWGIKDAIKLADYKISNNGSINDLNYEIKEIIKKFIKNDNLITQLMLCQYF